MCARWGVDLPIHVIDFEGAPSYGVVEVGVATLVGGKIEKNYSRLCQAFAPIDPSDIAVHGISYEESLKHDPFADDYEIFSALRKTGALAAHNARYEAKLIKQVWAFPPSVPNWLNIQNLQSDTLSAEDKVFGESNSWAPWIDSCALARKLAPGLERYKLSAVVDALGLQNELDALAIDQCPKDRAMYHTALYDAFAAALILKKLLCGDLPELPAEKLFSLKTD